MGGREHPQRTLSVPALLRPTACAYSCSVPSIDDFLFQDSEWNMLLLPTNIHVQDRTMFLTRRSSQQKHERPLAAEDCL